MAGRLIVAVITTIAEEAILVAIVLWGLPRLGINVPLGVLIAIMVLLAANAVFFYRVGSRALRRKPVSGLGSAVGARGRVISPLVPEGLVKIKGELWVVNSAGKEIGVDVDVIVVEQERLKLVVQESQTE